MNETPSNFWKRPLRGPVRLLAWFALALAASFVIVYGIALGTAMTVRGPGLVFFALVLSVALVGLASAGLVAVRWLSSWRNLRRALFGAACLATLLALAYAEENWRGRHAWQKHRQKWEAKGEKFAIAALVPPAVPDEKNFALTPLLKPMLDLTRGPTGVVWRDTNGTARLERIAAELSPKRDTNDHLVLGSLEKGTFADVGACAEFYRGNTNYPQCASSGKAAEAILVALGKFDPELQELRQAAADRPYCRFPIQYDYEPCWAILLPHLARLKALTQVLHVRATAALEAGRVPEAFEDLKLGWRFSDGMREEPILIDHLLRLATLAIDLQTVREGLVRHAWTDAQLAELETYLSSLNLLAEHKLAMRGERAFSSEGLDYLRRQGWRTDPMYYLGSDGQAESTSGSGFNLMPSGWYYQNMLTMSDMFQDFTLPTVDERAHRVFPEISQKGRRALESLRTGPYTIFVKMLLPALERAALKSARMQTYVDATRVACALERHRLANSNCPESLEALVPRFLPRIPNDVIDGKPLRYRPQTDGSYVLYSIGWNQTDEGGRLAWAKERKDSAVDASQGDWVWEMKGR